MQIYEIVLNTIANYSDKLTKGRPMPKSSKMTKTEMFINILYAVTSAPGRKIGHAKLIELMGEPSKANLHKNINELTKGMGTMEPILNVSDDKKPENRIYKLNSEVWDNFVSAGAEGYFFLEAFKRLGKIISCDYTKVNFSESMELEGRKVVDLDRKFMSLSKVEAKVTPKYKHTVDLLVKGLLENKQVNITYTAAGLKGESERTIEPLTLCQYRDDLYIICNKVEGDFKEVRNYKISRIEEIELMDENFSYPSRAKWNPEMEYKEGSGIFNGEIQKAMIKVYGHSRSTFKEKSIFNNFLIKQTEDFDQYQCSFSNLNEFTGQLFVYAQDIEVLTPANLKKSFLDKALSAITRNSHQIEDDMDVA
jgi:hypothetical protein